MISTAVLTSLSKPILKLSEYSRLYKCYSRLTRSRNLVQLLQVLAWGSFLPSYDPSHCPLTLQGHKHRYSHCLAVLEPHWGCTTKILKSSSNGHFSFDSTAQSVPQSKMLKIPRERATQCACAGTYSVCIAPTQPAQQIFEKSRSAGRHMSSKAGKGLSLNLHQARVLLCIIKQPLKGHLCIMAKTLLHKCVHCKHSSCRYRYSSFSLESRLPQMCE